MATEPGLGTAERYLIRITRAAGRPLHSALKGWHGEKGPSHGYRKPLPGLRRVLFLFVELAAVHYRGRCGARSDSGKVRQRKTVGHALRRRTLFGSVRQDRGGDLVRNL